MPKCKSCGNEMDKPEKTWTMTPKGRKPLTVGLFKCPKCGKYSRLKV